MDYNKIKKAFEAHGFSTVYCETKKQATDYLCGLLSGRTIGFGGSMTIHEMGLFDALGKNNVTVWHHHIGGDEIKELASHCKIYITSANAVSETGEIINIDGAGNRISMTLYGPEKVYYVIGRNKIAPNREAALFRAKNIACPKNAQRQKVKTPCAVRGDKCYDCNSPERICNCTIILDRVPNRLLSELIFINEDLGF